MNCKRIKVPLFGLIVAGLMAGSAPRVRAQGDSYVSIDVQGAMATFGRAINSEGVMVGWYTDSSGKAHGFVRTPDGTLTTLELPVAVFENNALGINARGDIVGSYHPADQPNPSFCNQRGYLLTAMSEFTTIEVPGSVFTVARTINSRGDIAGFYGDSGCRHLHGYLRSRDGEIVSIEVPGATDTQAFYINNRGEVVGSFWDASGACHGFLRSADGEFTQIDVPFPGGHDTQAFGNNARGDVVGCYAGADGRIHAWVRSSSDGQFSSFDFPSATPPLATIPFGINSAEDIVGQYFDGKWHAFLRSKAG